MGQVQRDAVASTSAVREEGLLQSWRDGPARRRILQFLDRVTRPGPDFVPPLDRVAVFDLDGTLWCEYPIQAHIQFACERARKMVRANPRLAQVQPFKTFFDRDAIDLRMLEKHALLSFAIAVHSGLTVADYTDLVQTWLAVARHPLLGLRYLDLVFRPQLELLRLLDRMDFQLFIVTGSVVEFVRAFAEDVYGIPADHVIGSSLKLQLTCDEAGCELVRQPELRSLNDCEAKAENIALHVGRRPVLAFGSSDGDLAMLRYTLAGRGPRLGLLLHHDDAAREFAYDRGFQPSPLSKALDLAEPAGVQLVSMRQDWSKVFARAA